jgi:hypothetical protein
LTCVWRSIELEAAVTKTPEIEPIDIINDEQLKEKPAAPQFFRSLLNHKHPHFSPGAS